MKSFILNKIAGAALIIFLLLAFMPGTVKASVCDVVKNNGAGYSTYIHSVVCNNNGTYTIVLWVQHDACHGPSCPTLSHLSVEADEGTYSNISVLKIDGNMTYSNIEFGPHLGDVDPDGFKIDGIQGIGDGQGGTFSITYTLTSLQPQQVSAKAGNNHYIASFAISDFTSVMNCNNTGCNPVIVGPQAVDDYATTPKNTPVAISILLNDIHGSGELVPSTVSFIAGTAPPSSKGVFDITAPGVVTFTPAHDYTGTATIKYNVCDENALCAVATITVTIPSSIVGPQAVDDYATTPMNTPVHIHILDNDIPGSGVLDPTSVTFVSTVVPSGAGVFTEDNAGIATFAPANNYTGTASIKYSVCDVNSLCAVATITVTITPPGTDSDNDGCTDDVDDYPNDPTRCFDNYFPANGNGTLVYEDLWPAQGDYDCNDLVCDYRFKTVTDHDNKVVEIFGSFTIKAFGASYHNGFGFQFPNNNIDPSKITVTGHDLHENYVTIDANGLEHGQSKPTIIVYDDAFNLMPYPGQGIGVNTTPDAPYVTPVTIAVHMAFSSPLYTMAQINIGNFNPFIIVDKNRDVEVHLPDYPPTSLANPSYFGQIDDNSDPQQGRYYKTANNLPWAFNICESFAYPIEKVDIINAYNHFVEWATSGGVDYPDWYKDLPGYRNDSNIYHH